MLNWFKNLFGAAPDPSPSDDDRLMAFIMAVDERDTLGCEDCYDLLDRYADMLMAGERPEDVLPKVKRHLDECPCCDMELDALVSIAEQMAAAG